MRRYAWVMVGCLECGVPTVFNGCFDTLEAAQVSIASCRQEARLGRDDDPVVLTEGLVVGADRGDSPWYGSTVDVIIIIEEDSQ